MYKKGFLYLSVLLVVFLLLGMLVLGGCETVDPPVDDDDVNGVPDTPDPEPDPTPSLKTITVAMAGKPLTMDPVDHRTRITQTFHRLFSDAIVWATPEGNLVPCLAEKITMVDPVTYDIKIREDVYFHNGDHMTADDLAFSLTRIAIEGGMEGDTATRRTYVGPVESVEKVGAYTVRLNLERPNLLLQDRNWMHVDIWPKSYFEEVGIEGFIEQPIGAGPFKWIQGDLVEEAVLERHDLYYGGCPEMQGEVDRMPALDRVIVRYIEEPTTRVAALMAGDVDIIQEVPIDSIELLQNNPDTNVVVGLGTSVVHLGFNTGKAPFDDKRVRQAIAYAIDYDLLAEQLMLGYTKPLYALPFIEPFEGEPGSGAFDGIQSPYKTRNVEKAKVLLQEAGISGLTTVIDSWPGVDREAQAIAQILSDIGIDASVRVWDSAVLLAEWRKDDNRRDMYVRSGGFARRSPHGYGAFNQAVKSDIGGGASWGSGNYYNETFDELMAQAIPMEDSPERNALFIEAFELMLEEVPVIFIHEPVVVEAVRSNIKNYYPCSQGRINLHKVDIE